MHIKTIGVWAIPVFVVALLIFVFWPVHEGGGEPADQAACLSNVKQLGLGNQIYASDFDDKLPSRDSWMDLLGPSMHDASTLHCSKVERKGLYGYALNAGLKKLGDATEPVSVLLVYDSVNLARNASDLGNSLPSPGRHHGKDNVGYADGHAKSLRVP